jgi:hypothetical protein
MKTCLPAAILLVLAGPTLADATLSYRGATPECRMDFDTLRVSGSRLRIDGSVIGMDTSAIYDGLEQMLVGLDHREKTFSQMELDDDAQDFQGDVASALGTRTQKEMGKAKDAMAEARAQYEAQCKKSRRECPPMPQFEMVEDMLENPGAIDLDAMMAMQEQSLAQMDPKMLERAGMDPEQMKAQMKQSRDLLAAQQREASDVSTPTGETRTVQGVSCAVIEKRIGEQLIETRCEADASALPLDERDAKGFQRGIARLTKMADTWRPLGEKVTGQKMQDEQRGLVIEKTCYDERGEETARVEMQLVKGAVDATAFDVPAGYKPAGFAESVE